MAIMILFGTSVATTGKFSTLAYVEAPTFDHRVRSSTQLDIGAVNQLCGEERYDEALRLLDRFIRAYPQSAWVAYAHYSAGLIYLHIAYRSTLGLFPSYDPVHVAAGLDHLEISATISPNVRLVEESCWLRAKGFLMLERPDEALLELQKMELLDGSLKTEAADLIRKIQARG
jgi:tetratricopeptide (TPR) repeat protein